MMGIWEIIRASIAVIVIAVVVLILLGFFNPLYAAIRGGKLNIEQQQQNEDNFDVLISNIDKCLSLQNNDCVCDGLPNFPASFVQNSNLVFTELPGRAVEITLTHGNKDYKSTTLSDLKISAIFYETKQEVPYRIKKVVDFSKEPPLFKQEGSKKGALWWSEEINVISPFFYKKQDGLYFVISYEKPPIIQLERCAE
ncbi:MAG: hypothetical protein IB618_03470 [Candidatus Pacearchaeota archaeon]|nr:MAG: hypothetical protein IB618_03470 [Candidatus Pacearchaeota archaeon]